jgi:hypothetical protein
MAADTLSSTLWSACSRTMSRSCAARRTERQLRVVAEVSDTQQGKGKSDSRLDGTALMIECLIGIRSQPDFLFYQAQIFEDGRMGDDLC